MNSGLDAQASESGVGCLSNVRRLAVKLTLLPGPPISGSVSEEHFDAFGDCTWVHFDDEVGGCWAGAFGTHRLVDSFTVLFSDERTALVSAGGQGYLVDLTGRRLLFRTDAILVGGITVPDRPFVVVHDWVRLYALGKEGSLWKSHRIAMDGIELLGTTEKTLHGRAWDGDWHTFTLAYDGWAIEGGSSIAAAVG